MFYLSRREFRIFRNFIILTASIFIFMIGYIIAEKLFFPKDKIVSITNNKEEEMTVHFLNTGNSDCILIKGEKNILIDGADNDDEKMIVAYLNKEGIKKIDYLISTHYHKDHLGSLDRVIYEFDIDKVFVSNGINDTNSYYNFINALKSKGIRREIPNEGEKIMLSDKAYMKIYNTNGGEYTNDESLITLVCNGNDKFLFAADAERKAELEVLDKLEEVDLLKVGHHGSSTSTSDEFLNILKPKFAVITNSEMNLYGNPAKPVMKKLKERNIEVHRTDECGNIVFKSTGNGISTECGIGSYKYRTMEEIKGVAN